MNKKRASNVNEIKLIDEIGIITCLDLYMYLIAQQSSLHIKN